jgi:hypothetical protein
VKPVNKERAFMVPQIETIITVAVLTLPTCYLAVKFLFRKEADLYFQKRLEQFRADLKLLTQQAEFDYSRKISVFNIFFQKKHDSYFKFYDLITHAIGSVHSLFGFRRETPIEMMRVPDIERTLKNCGCSDALVADYMDRIKRLGLDAVSDDLRKLMRSIEFDKAERDCVKAKNHLIIFRLYFEPSLFDVCSTLCRDLLFLHLEFREAFEAPGSGSAEKQKDLKDKIDSGLEEVIRLMQAELRVGYFESICKTQELDKVPNHKR